VAVVKTRAELIEGLSRLQMDRLEHGWDNNYLAKKYWYYHDKNAKLGTLKLKNRIAREVIWKAQSNRI
jgi:hypothetical protein